MLEVTENLFHIFIAGKRFKVAHEDGAIVQWQRVRLYVAQCITLRCGFVSPACALEHNTVSSLPHPCTGI